MVYLVIKELASTAEDVIMVTSSIMKDTAVGSDVVYRANAIRALCRIIDGQNVQAIERLIKTAIVDKTPSVSSAALVSAYHLHPLAKDVVRRWANETQEAVQATKSFGSSLISGFGGGSSAASGTGMSQYHAIGLLYKMREHDRMALVKMVQQFGQAGVVKNAAGVVLLVRLAAKLAEEDPNLRKPMWTLLDGWLRHKAEMVNFEAAKAICNLSNVTDQEVAPAIHVLQLFLTSPRNVSKFTAIRILHSFASIRPAAVNPCNMDIENLISNPNRSIATFAITTLLKTGNEASVDRLMKQISGFMADITDEFKITIVEAIRTLCLKFPQKQAGMLTFLSGVLRDEGGYEFKKSVVESMFDLIKFVSESREEALAHLCEFIEDCEFTKLAVRILHLLGTEGPKTSQPTKFIRYIYNRVVLENAIVRAAAVTALAKFGAGECGIKHPDVKKSVIVLLTRCLDDPDDEVRDRAALNLKLIQEEDQTIAERFVKNESTFSLPVLEHQLIMYVTGDPSTFSTPFDLSSIPIVTRAEADAQDRNNKLRSSSALPTLKPPTTGPSPSSAPGIASVSDHATTSAAAQTQKYAVQLATVPELKPYGALLKSSKEVPLTESEQEYVVTAVRHIFKNHLVLQFNIRNTLPEVLLENVTVLCQPSLPEGEEEDAGEPRLEEEFIIPAPALRATDEAPGVVYVAFKRSEASEPEDPEAEASDFGYAIATFSNTLKFTMKEIDPTTGEPEDTGYEDEYSVEDLELQISDYLVPSFASSYQNLWEQIGAAGEEASETYKLSAVKGIQEACETIPAQLGLQPLEGSDLVVTQNAATHVLKLFGKTIGGGRVVATVKMAYSTKSGMAVKITCRSEEEGVATRVAGAIA